MSLFVLTPEAVWNPGLLRFSTAPRKILQRGTLLPRPAQGGRLFFRALFESQLLRFALTLLPFAAAGMIWPAIALPLGSAPIAMIAAIALVEMRLLRLPHKKRKSVVSQAEADRALDTLNFRGRRILSQLAAARGIERGAIYLVVEQSDMGRIPPLTIASLQLDEGKSRLAPLTKEEQQIIRSGLFDKDFTETDLFRANQREGVWMRSVTFEARGVSAHARLAAILEATPAPQEAPA